MSGDVITLDALALNQLTGSSIPQGIAAVLIGLGVIRTSLRPGKRSHDFLVGVWLLPPRPRRPPRRRRGTMAMTSPSHSGPLTKTEYAPSSSATQV